MYFNYELGNAGWAKARFGPDDNVVEMTVSYLSDSLRQLAIAARDLSNGATEAEVLFEDEPGEHWLRLRRVDEATIEFAVVRKDDYDAKEEPRCSGRCAINEFKIAVLLELQRLYAENGEAGYLQKWQEHTFPTEEMRQLEGTGC